MKKFKKYSKKKKFGKRKSWTYKVSRGGTRL